MDVAVYVDSRSRSHNTEVGVWNLPMHKHLQLTSICLTMEVNCSSRCTSVSVAPTTHRHAYTSPDTLRCAIRFLKPLQPNRLRWSDLRLFHAAGAHSHPRNGQITPDQVVEAATRTEASIIGVDDARWLFSAWVPKRRKKERINVRSWARSPVGEQEEHILHANSAVAVEVGWSAGIGAPCAEQRQQIRHTDRAVAVDIPGTLLGRFA